MRISRGRGRCACAVRVGAEVAGGVDGPDSVRVARAGAEPGVGVGRARPARRGDLGERGAARTLAALDPVAGHPDVVARRAPGEIDLCRARGARGERSRRRGRLRIDCAAADRSRHVRLDLGQGEGAVVDADFVDCAAEVLAVDAVASDLELVRRGRDRASARGSGRLRTVHVQPDRAAVVRDDKVGPRARRQRSRALDVIAAPAEGAAAGRGRPAGRGCLQVVVVVTFVNHVAPGVADGGWTNPCLESHPGTELKRRGVRDIYPGARPIEDERLAILAVACPGGVRDRSRVPVPRRIRHRRARCLVKRIRRHQPGRRRRLRHRRAGGRCGHHQANRRERDTDESRPCAQRPDHSVSI